jgi:hypothetical protein
VFLQVGVISGDQISLDISVQGRLLDWFIPAALEDLPGAGRAKEIADQDAARTVDKSIQRQCVLTFVFHYIDRTLGTGRAQVAIIEPVILDGFAKLRSCLQE